MQSKLAKWLSVLLPIFLGLGLTIYSYNSFNEKQMAEMKSYFVNANYNFVLLSLVFAVLGYVLRAYRWKYTLSEIGCQSGFKINFLAVSIGYFVNLSVPRAGEVSRALIIKKYENQPFDKVFGTIIAERIVDLIILLFFIAIALFVEFATLKNFLLTNIPLEKLAVLAIAGVICTLLFLYLYFYSNLKIIQSLKLKIEGLKVGAFSVVKMPHKWLFLFYTLMIWLSYVLMFYCTTFALHATAAITFGTILVAFVIGSLTIAFTNGGFGFFPILIAKILFLYHIPLEAGNAFGWIVWTSQLLITVILGILAFFVLPFVSKNK